MKKYRVLMVHEDWVYAENEESAEQAFNYGEADQSFCLTVEEIT